MVRDDCRQRALGHKRSRCGDSARHVLGPGTRESPSTARLQPSQAGGWFGLFIFKHYLLLSINKIKETKTTQGRCILAVVGTCLTRKRPWVPPLLRVGWDDGSKSFGTGLSSEHTAHTNLGSAHVTSVISGRRYCLAKIVLVRCWSRLLSDIYFW